MRKLLLGLSLLSASAPAFADDGIAQAIIPNRAPSEILASMTRNCIAERMLIEETTPNGLVCSKVMTGGRGFAAQLLIGNAYSTPPKDKLRVTVVAVGPDTQIQVQHTIETQMAFGQIKVVPGGSKQLQQQLDREIARTASDEQAKIKSAETAHASLDQLEHSLPSLPSERLQPKM
jgi:hypothetical protein